jgi:hypothetical protein
MKKLLAIPLVILCVCACASYNALVADRDELNDSIKAYNDLVRRNDFEKAKSFAVDTVRQEFAARAAAAKDVRVAEYRILSVDYEDHKGAEIVKVQFDYYLPASSALKTLVDEQVWSFVYVKEEGSKRWKLMTPLPDFASTAPQKPSRAW